MKSLLIQILPGAELKSCAQACTLRGCGVELSPNVFQTCRSKCLSNVGPNILKEQCNANHQGGFKFVTLLNFDLDFKKIHFFFKKERVETILISEGASFSDLKNPNCQTFFLPKQPQCRLF